MTCGVREARDQFSRLRRRALNGEEIVIKPDLSDDPESQAVSLVATWLIDELTAKVTNWTITWLGEPGAPVSDWEFHGKAIREIPSVSKATSYVVEHKATGITGVGNTKDEAIESMIDGLMEYADEYFSALPFYLSPKSGRRDHYPYVRIIKRISGDRKRLRDLFQEETYQ